MRLRYGLLSTSPTPADGLTLLSLFILVSGLIYGGLIGAAFVLFSWILDGLDGPLSRRYEPTSHGEELDSYSDIAASCSLAASFHPSFACLPIMFDVLFCPMYETRGTWRLVSFRSSLSLLYIGAQVFYAYV